MKRAAFCLTAAVAIAAFLVAAPARLFAETAVAISSDDIGGVVTGPHGPEAGVWVIAETHDLPTRYAKIVVTDDQGRYVVPDLPKAKYQVWVRGYGLVDSAKVDAVPGKRVNLTAVPAPSDTAAAQYYPAIYWFSMLKIPDKDQFGGKSDIPANLTQVDWLTTIKNQACVGCHQLGQLSTRTIPAALGEFKNGEEAWARRVQSGQASPLMVTPLAGKFGGVPFKYFGDWTDRGCSWRVAVRQAGAAAGRRTQSRDHDLGLGQRETISPRPDLVRQAQSDGRCQRSALRLDRICDRQSAGARSEDREGQLHHAAGRRERARSLRPGTCRDREAGGGVGLLGHGAGLGYQIRQSQRHVRRQGPGLDDRNQSRARHAGVLQERLEQSLRQGVSARHQ